MLPMPGGKNELRPVTLKGHSCLLVTFFAGPLSQSPRSLQSNHRRINWQSAYAKGSQPLTAQRIISFQVSAADHRDLPGTVVHEALPPEQHGNGRFTELAPSNGLSVTWSGH